ncbi:MAG: MATE family efflux transporter [Myxococcota bacterium]
MTTTDSPPSVPPLTAGTLWRLAWPSAIFTVLTTAYRIVDQYYMQYVSVPAQAAVGSSVFVAIVFYASFEVLAAGAGPLIARATGAADPRLRRSILGAALWGAGIVTLLVMIVGTWGASWIAASVGLTGDTAAAFAAYLSALSLTILPLVLTPLVDQAFLATGEARLPMVLHGASLALNIALTPLFVLTFEGGVVGAALASNLARAMTTGIGLVILIQRFGLQREHLRPADQLRRVLRVGAPMAANTALYALVYWALLRWTVSPLGPHINAALGIGFSALEGMAWPVFHGLSLAVASLVGRYLGAGRRDLAWGVVKLALPATTGMGLMASGAFFFGGRWLSGLFTEDPAVLAATTQYALILSASQLFVAWESLTEGVLAGAGDTKSVFWWSMPFNLLRIPLAWMWAFPWGAGAVGVWWAINLTTYAKVLGKGTAVVRGRWLELRP